MRKSNTNTVVTGLVVVGMLFCSFRIRLASAGVERWRSIYWSMEWRHSSVCRAAYRAASHSMDGSPTFRRFR